MPTKKELPIYPVGARVLLEPIKVSKEETKKVGNIIIADTAKKEDERVSRGTVIAVGSGFKNVIFEVGMKVIFNSYAPVEVKDGETPYLIVQEEDIIAVCQ